MGSPALPRIWPAFSLLLAGLQLVLFAPQVAGARSIDFSPFRVDALNLAFGVAWSLAAGLGFPAFVRGRTGSSVRLLLCLVLFSAGLLCISYSRDLFLFIVGWELAGLALWLSLVGAAWEGSVGRVALAIHLPGLLLLMALLFDAGRAFAPPQGGGATPWPLYVAALFGLVALFRAACWLLLTPPIANPPATLLLPLYILVSPFLLAKALVAAPWEDLGIWLLALMGTVGLLLSLFASRFLGGRMLFAACACASISVAALGLAPLSPLAAAGAVALLLVGAIWIAASTWTYRGAVLLLAALPGIWLISQGALDGGYRLVAATLLPAVLVLAYYSHDGSESTQSRSPGMGLPLLAACLPVAAAIYPQVAVEWVFRPAVGAMAGGVGVPATLVTDGGLGLLVRSPQESVLAALPATGMALAVFLGWVALYLLRWLGRAIAYARRPERGVRDVAPATRESAGTE